MIHEQSVAQLVAARKAGRVSVAEITDAYLQRIDRHAQTLNALITVTDDTARTRAGELDEAGSGTLAGVPILHKDCFCTRGVKTSCGSRMLDNFAAPYNATVVEHLQAAGTVMLGKTNMDEFAMGSSNENSYYGAVHNPWNTACVPGGSSGGSAAAVAADLAPAATGTDTGGSIREPAALCGVTGIKPTYGRVSRHGQVACASSLDQGGCLARSAEDCAHVLKAMAGFDPRDPTSLDREVPDYPAHLDGNIEGLRIGLPRQYFDENLPSPMRDVIKAATGKLRELGAELVEVDMPYMPMAIPAYYVIAPAEAASNLARYDGVRYGHRCADPKDMEDLYQRSRAEGFGPEVQRRILLGTLMQSREYYESHYQQARKVRRLICRGFEQAYEQVDIIAAPVTRSPAFALGDKSDDPLAMYRNDIYTLPASLAGVPGMSVPAGFIDELPVGLQLLASWFEEEQLLNTAHAFQQITDWHTRRPSAFE